MHVAECLVEAPFRVVGASSAAATAAAHRREWRWRAADQELLFAGSYGLAPDSALEAQPVAIAACPVRQRSRKSGAAGRRRVPALADASPKNRATELRGRGSAGHSNPTLPAMRIAEISEQHRAGRRAEEVPRIARRRREEVAGEEAAQCKFFFSWTGMGI